MKRNRRGKLEVETAQTAYEVHDTAKMYVDTFQKHDNRFLIPYSRKL